MMVLIPDYALMCGDVSCQGGNEGPQRSKRKRVEHMRNWAWSMVMST